MGVRKKTVGSTKSQKPTPKSGSKKVAATRITSAKLHTTVDASGGFQ